MRAVKALLLSLFTFAAAGCALQPASGEEVSSTGEAIVPLTCDPGYAPSCSLVKGRRVCTCEPIDPPTYTSCLDVPADIHASGGAITGDSSASYVHGAVCDRRVSELTSLTSRVFLSAYADPSAVSVAHDADSCARTHFTGEIYGLAADGWRVVRGTVVSSGVLTVWMGVGSCHIPSTNYDATTADALSGITTVRFTGKAWRDNADGTTTLLPVVLVSGGT